MNPLAGTEHDQFLQYSISPKPKFIESLENDYGYDELMPNPPLSGPGPKHALFYRPRIYIRMFFRKSALVPDNPNTTHALQLSQQRKQIDSSSVEMTGSILFNSENEGPYNHAHGASIAAVFDQILGLCAYMCGSPSLTGEVTIRFRHRVPLNKHLRFDVWITNISGRKIYCESKIYSLAEDDCDISTGEKIYSIGTSVSVTSPLFVRGLTHFVMKSDLEKTIKSKL